MKILWHEMAWDDFEFWIDNDKNIAKKIRRLVKEIKRDPFNGIGKPEPLKQMYSGYWSRRITDEHRLVYKVKDDILIITQARYHYD